MKFAMKQYILNQIICKAKLFTVLGSQYIGNLELFGLTNILVSTLCTMNSILCGDIKNGRSKI